MMSAFRCLSTALVASLFLAGCSLNSPQTPSLTSLASQSEHEPVRRMLDIQHWETSTGTAVFFAPSLELPMLDVRLTFAAGSSQDGEVYGLASLTNALIDAGTQSSSADEIALTFEQLGALFSTSSHRDMAIIQLRTLSDPAYSQPALKMLAEVLAEPAFPNAAIERLKNQYMASFAQQKKNPGQLANLELFQQLYGTHPYAHSSSGTEHSLPGISRHDLQAFYTQFYTAKNVQIVLVGDLDRQRAEQIAEQLANALPKGQSAPPVATPEVPAEKRHHIEFDSNQTHILLAQLGIERGHPDYAALFIGNQIFGGSGFGSRLMEEVREKRGLTYGIYSYFSPMQARGPFVISVQTRADLSEATLTYVKELLADYIQNGPTEAELDSARNEFLGSFPLNSASNSAIAGQLSSIGFYNLPQDWLEQLMQQVRELNTQDIQAAWQRHIDVDSLITITVGPTVEQQPLPEPVARPNHITGRQH